MLFKRRGRLCFHHHLAFVLVLITFLSLNDMKDQMKQSVLLQRRKPCTSNHAILIQFAEVVWVRGQLFPGGPLHYLPQLISLTLNSPFFKKKKKEKKTWPSSEVTLVFHFLLISVLHSWRFSLVLLINDTAVIINHGFISSIKQQNKQMKNGNITPFVIMQESL